MGAIQFCAVIYKKCKIAKFFVSSHTNVPCVLETTPLQTVTSAKHFQLYSLGSSPICVNEVEKSLLLYPLQEVTKELIEGLRFGFKLKYTGTRLPVLTKNSKVCPNTMKSLAEKPKKKLQWVELLAPLITRLCPLCEFPRSF